MEIFKNGIKEGKGIFYFGKARWRSFLLNKQFLASYPNKI